MAQGSVLLVKYRPFKRACKKKLKIGCGGIRLQPKGVFGLHVYKGWSPVKVRKKRPLITKNNQSANPWGKLKNYHNQKGNKGVLKGVALSQKGIF